MCGIAGFFQTSGFDRDFAKGVLQRMGDAIRYRGPDAEGYWMDNTLGLGLVHRRLSIQDLSSLGSQPMLSRCQRYVIVFNGEIYNFLNLKSILEKKGSVFRGQSDTEVLLNSIVEWGIEETLKRVEGMFAFALFDNEKKNLILARDRIGEKPLYFGWQKNVFLFASELKALRLHPGWQSEVDRDALNLLLRHNYIPQPFSIYKDIYKLRPGSFAVLNLKQREELSFHSYWDPADYYKSTAFEGEYSEEEIVLKVEELLKVSVKKQMVSDVPLGAFLSGGVDSSMIVALMQSLSEKKIKTFSIGFNEKEYNEADYAKKVSEHLKTDHTELYVTSQQAMDVIAKLPTLYDEPFADSSQIPTYLLAQMTKEHVTVSLSGDGGDELFSGYTRYFNYANRWQKYQRYPYYLRWFFSKMVKRSPAALFNFTTGLVGRSFNNKEHDLLKSKIHEHSDAWLFNKFEEYYRHAVSFWKKPSNAMLGSNQEPNYLFNQFDHQLDDTALFKKMMYLDLCTYLPDDILVKIDRAAMAVSLETRVPMLDRNLVEFVAQIPAEINNRHKNGKWLLRQILYKYVPKELIERPKRGFAVPVSDWIRGPMRDWAEDLLDYNRIKEQGYFDPELITKKWHQHLNKEKDWSFHLWSVLMFQGWLESIH